MAESFLIPAFIVVASVLVDALVGEPVRGHPLVGFGWLAAKLERAINRPAAAHNRIHGVFAALLLVVPLPLLLLVGNSAHYPLIELVLLYLAIGRKSLVQHARAVFVPLQQQNPGEARKKLSRIVSRDTTALSAAEISKATVESVIENSNDAVLGPIFWYLLAGGAGVVLYRTVNTLDAMWGYRNERYRLFGWAAARLDDGLNWLPARLTVISFAVFGSFAKVIQTAFRQGKHCKSPNAGPVMAAGACALNVKLGGDAWYQGELISKPVLGYGAETAPVDIERAVRLVNHTVMLWLAVIVIAAVLIH